MLFEDTWSIFPMHARGRNFNRQTVPLLLKCIDVDHLACFSIHRHHVGKFHFLTSSIEIISYHWTLCETNIKVMFISCSHEHQQLKQYILCTLNLCCAICLNIFVQLKLMNFGTFSDIITIVVYVTLWSTYGNITEYHTPLWIETLTANRQLDIETNFNVMFAVVAVLVEKDIWWPGQKEGKKVTFWSDQER